MYIRPGFMPRPFFMGLKFELDYDLNKKNVPEVPIFSNFISLVSRQANEQPAAFGFFRLATDRSGSAPADQ